MSRYFEVNVDELYKDQTEKAPGIDGKTLTTKKLRIKKRRQLRLQKQQLRKTVEDGKISKKNTKTDGEKLVDEKRIQYYSRGEGLHNVDNVKTNFFKKKLIAKEKKIDWASEQSARAELLLTEEAGYCFFLSFYEFFSIIL